MNKDKQRIQLELTIDYTIFVIFGEDTNDNNWSYKIHILQSKYLSQNVYTNDSKLIVCLWIYCIFLVENTRTFEKCVRKWDFENYGVRIIPKEKLLMI